MFRMKNLESTPSSCLNLAWKEREFQLENQILFLLWIDSRYTEKYCKKHRDLRTRSSILDSIRSYRLYFFTSRSWSINYNLYTKLAN